MPAVLEDASAAPIYRSSGRLPFAEPSGPLPADIQPRQVTLRDRVTTATLLPLGSAQQVPPRLGACLCRLLNREIDRGDTYAQSTPVAPAAFAAFWLANFAAVAVVGGVASAAALAHMEARGVDWAQECLGSFCVKPNYPGRSSHVCTGSFLVADAARNRGVGRLMGEAYLEWAPRLGYSYSVFNLVYETNVAALRIWDALGFRRIGRVKGCGSLKSHPHELVDAILFGRELGGDGDECVSEERFDKIRCYLKTGAYPSGADRAEKSRLRSAATHYRLVPNAGGDGEAETLMLKDKQVVSDPHKQYEVARAVHAQAHAGINKTTAIIAEQYHWVRIKETVSAAVRNCVECQDTAAAAKSAPTASNRRGPSSAECSGTPPAHTRTARPSAAASADSPPPYAAADASPAPTPETYPSQTYPFPPTSAPPPQPPPHTPEQQPPLPGSLPAAPMGGMHYHDDVDTDYGQTPIDPQIMQGIPRELQQPWDEEHALRLDAADDTSTRPEHMGVDVDARLRQELEAQMAHESDRAFLQDQVHRERDREETSADRRIEDDVRGELDDWGDASACAAPQAAPPATVGGDSPASGRSGSPRYPGHETSHTLP